jgi:DNA-binding response OmpR family regulator
VAPRPSGKSTAEPASIVGGDESILVVDDEEAVLEVATETLRNAGYKVLTASDGADGVTAFEQRGGEIDMVVLDVMMPRMGGRLAFFKMRELDPTIPVLIMSGYSTEEDIQVMVDAGVNGFIEKPFVLTDLLSKVREILDRRREQLPAAK